MRVGPFLQKKKGKRRGKERIGGLKLAAVQSLDSGDLLTERKENLFLRYLDPEEAVADRISIPFPFQGNKIHPIRMFNVQAMEHRFRFHPQNKIFPRVNIA